MASDVGVRFTDGLIAGLINDPWTRSINVREYVRRFFNENGCPTADDVEHILDGIGYMLSDVAGQGMLPHDKESRLFIKNLAVALDELMEVLGEQD